MGQILTADNIPNLVVASTTSLTLAATNLGSPTAITIGGQQYIPSGTITLSTAGTGANGLDTGALGVTQLWYVYAIVHQTTFITALVASQTTPTTGPTMPSGYGTPYKLVGAFYTNSVSQVASIVTIIGTATSDWISFTATGSFNTNTVYTGSFRRNGTMMDINWKLTFSGVPNSTTLNLDMPSGFTNSSVATLGSPDSCGTARFRDGGVQTYLGTMVVNTSSSIGVLGTGGTAATTNEVTQAIPFTIGSGDIFDLRASVPITGWNPTLL